MFKKLRTMTSASAQKKETKSQGPAATAQFSPRARSFSGLAMAADASPARRVILLFGYWPPTDIGITNRHGMLWKWRTVQENYKNSGYDVLAITPTFNASLGWIDQAHTDPYWGKGTGQLTVDYRKTSEDFWSIVDQYNPIAIMSFSRGNRDKSWELESSARNLAQATWDTQIPYTDNNGNPQTGTWDPPYAGGSANDFSPYKNQGTITNNPPDRSQAAGLSRSSNLPMTQIKDSINGHFPNPPGNVVASVDNTGDVGGFVSEYMAYHVGWYRAYINDANKCKATGHTHVGVFVAPANGETAVDLQLDELFKVLP